MPTVTVLMPAYNAETTIDRAITSVLSQTFRDFELLVIDDGSTDDTAGRLSAWESDERVRVVRRAQNGGLVAALNLGVELAQGTYIARLDADDTAQPARLAVQVAAMRSNPRAVLCAGGYRRIRPDDTCVGVRVPPTRHADLAVSMLAGNRLSHSTAMFTSEAVRRAGGYDPAWFPVEDYDLWLRLIAEGEYCGVPEVLGDYLENPGGISAVRQEAQRDRHRERVDMYRLSVDPRWRDGGSPRAKARRVALLAQRLLKGIDARGIDASGTDVIVNRLLHESVGGLGRPMRYAILFAAAPALQARLMVGRVRRVRR